MMNKTYISRAIFFFCTAIAAAHAAEVDLSKPAPVVEHKTPVLKGNGASDQAVEFTTWKSGVQYSDTIGRMEFGLFCSGGKPVLYNKPFDEWLSSALGRRYRERAVELGLSMPEASKSVFDDKSKQAAGFQLGATLLQLDYRMCVDEDQVKGTLYAKIKWEVFSSRKQKVVYSTVIESSASSTSKIDTKKFDRDFFEATVDNLFADPKLAEVVKSGGAVDAEPAKALPPLQIVSGPTVTGGVSKAASQLQRAVVTVESGVGSGSAFFISRDGYLLTNEHVVGGATFVRVRLADGRSVVGEVVRTNKQYDVALLRTDPVNFDVLALRGDEARVGEDVYAIGSPFGKELSGTLTRGVLSAKRVMEGIPYLQSDAAVNPGNSGGALVDGEGRVLGIAQLQSSGQGVNLFIPIEEALVRLSLGVGGKAVARSAN